MSTTPPPSRTRHACETCRKKKTKCPGEKPVCSLCQRLNQRCIYIRQDDGHRIQKDSLSNKDGEPFYSKEQVQRLEARMEQILDTVNVLVSQRTDLSTASVESIPGSDIRTPDKRPPQTRQSTNASPIENISTGARFNQVLSPFPPQSVIDSLIYLYEERVEYQSLPLFGPGQITTYLRRYKDTLLKSFLALMVRFSNNDFYFNRQAHACDYYANSARKALLEQVVGSYVGLEVVQSFCLLCLADVADGNVHQALMNIDIAVRWAACNRSILMSATQRSPIHSEALSRCMWSLFILDRIYGSGFQVQLVIHNENDLPETPSPLRRPIEHTNNLSGLTLRDPGEKDVGINNYGLQLLSIWGRLMPYLKNIKQGQGDEPWSINSKYQQLTTEMFHFETVFQQRHRFQVVKLHEITPQQMERNRYYWASWLFAQALYHSIQGLLNHPFIHAARRQVKPNFRPPSFLQRTIDQAILHSSWIVRLLEVYEEKKFAVYDPFLAHLAAINATVHFFLQFSKDGALVTETRRNFDTCLDFVRKMSKQWHHLTYTVDRLTKLAQIGQTQNTSVISAAPRADVSIMWDLLDYSISASPPAGRVETPSEAMELNVDTQHLLPLSQTTSTPGGTTTTYPAFNPSGLSGPNDLTDLNFDFDTIDFSELPDMAFTTLPLGDYFTNGQL